MGTVHAKESKFADPRQRFTTQREYPLEGVKARVDHIHIDGLERTKDDIVVEAVHNLFKAKDFQEVVFGAQEVRGKLESLGCFKNIGIYIDVSKGPEATPDGLDVTFYVKEMKRVIGGINTMVGNNEGSLILGMRFPNLYGRGERVHVEYGYGNKRTSSVNVTFAKPLRGKMNSVFSSSIFQQGSEWSWSGYKLLERGILLDLAFSSGPAIKHNLQWEGNWRELSCLSRFSTFNVREESGPSLKSCLRHILCVDRRDDLMFPTSGGLFRLTSELAGFGGNVGFFKNEALLQGNWSIMEDIVFQCAIQAGFLKHQTDKTVQICDKFFLGGPLFLRGFTPRGAGPQSDGCALGADLFWAGALHLYTPLPFRPGKGGIGEYFRTHFFINSGNIGNFELTDDMQHNIKLLTTDIRIAYGVGICLRIGQMARLELNYCVPLSFQKGDQLTNGVQFGIGASFL